MAEPVLLIAAALVGLLLLVLIWKVVKFGLRIAFVIGLGLIVVWGLRQTGILGG